jgi:HSP20 family protein
MNLKSLVPIGFGRNVSARHPFAELQSEIDRLFDQFSRGLPAFGTTDLVPSMDMAETDKQIEMTFELPGLESKDVDINLADNVLTVRGEKKAEKDEKDKNRRIIERSYGSFARSIELPAGVQQSDIKAAIANGVLTVTVTKPAPAASKKIEVKPAA